MPRNGSGTYSLPTGNPVEPNTTIETEWANTTLEDVGNELTNSLSRTGEGGMLAPLRFDDGTDSVPGMAWLTETSSGFYREGTAEFWATVLAEPVLQFTDNGVLVPSGKTFTVQGTQINSGSLDVEGNFAVNTDKFTVAAASGNTVVAGTLGVTGAITATGGVNGNITTSSATITGGTINGTAIGGSTAAAGAFTTLSASGAFSLSGDQVQVSEGGTGATTAATARVNLLPSYAGNALKFLRLNSGGTDVEWATEPSLGTVTSVNASGGTTGMSFTGGPVTSSGTLTMSGTLAVANGGTGSTTASGARTALGVAIGTDVPSPTGTGASGTWSIGISGNAGTVTNGVYTSGSYSDPAWITSLAGSKITGNISGNAGGLSSTLAVGSGGTGQTTYTDGQLLIGNSTGNTLTKATLTAGSGITVTNGNGSITIASTAGGGSVTSVDVSGGTTGLTTSGGPVTGSGTITLAGTLAVANGGTGATTAPNARTALGAAASGANSDITSLSGLTTALSVAQGGTGATTLTGYVKGSGTSAFTASSTIPTSDLSGTISLTSQVTGTLPVANGGTGVTTSTGTGSVVLSAGPTFTSSATFNVGGNNTATITSAGGYNYISLKGTNGSGGGTNIGLVGGATSDANLYIDANASGGNIVFRNAGTTERMRLDSSGNLGLGMTPTYKLDVTGGSNTTIARLVAGNASYGKLDFEVGAGNVGSIKWDNTASANTLTYNTGGGAQIFQIASAEKARIGTDGSFLVGTTTNAGAGVVRATGGFKTVTGSTSIVGGGPTTIFSMSAGGLYFVYAESAGGSTGYGCSAACVSVPYSSGVLRLAEGTPNNYISVSGSNVQVTTSLGTNTYNWSYIFIPSA